jgi:hypothetical protein
MQGAPPTSLRVADITATSSPQQSVEPKHGTRLLHTASPHTWYVPRHTRTHMHTLKCHHVTAGRHNSRPLDNTKGSLSCCSCIPPTTAELADTQQPLLHLNQAQCNCVTSSAPKQPGHWSCHVDLQQPTNPRPNKTALTISATHATRRTTMHALYCHSSPQMLPELPQTALFRMHN